MHLTRSRRRTLLWPRAKDPRANPHRAAALADRLNEVRTHAHAELEAVLLHAEQAGQMGAALAQRLEVRVLAFSMRRLPRPDGHEPHDLEGGAGVAHMDRQSGQLGVGPGGGSEWRQAGLGVLPGRVHLEVHVEYAVGIGLGERGLQLVRQLARRQRLENVDVGDGREEVRLVRLQRADEVPCDVGGELRLVLGVGPDVGCTLTA